MLPPRLAALYGEMEKVREETLSVLSGLTEEEFSRRAEGEWSAAQILHHIGNSVICRTDSKPRANNSLLGAEMGVLQRSC